MKFSLESFLAVALFPLKLPLTYYPKRKFNFEIRKFKHGSHSVSVIL